LKHARSFLLVVIGGAIAFAACTLNPQPLPPATPDGGSFSPDASVAKTGEDGGSFGGGADGTGGDNGAVDSGTIPGSPPTDEGGADGGDASDLDAADAAD
jgi:hypothetical protein